jgi:hypothetical protein
VAHWESRVKKGTRGKASSWSWWVVAQAAGDSLRAQWLIIFNKNTASEVLRIFVFVVRIPLANTTRPTDRRRSSKALQRRAR